MLGPQLSSIGDYFSDNWHHWQPQLLSIVFTALIISAICLVYNIKIRNHQEEERMSGFLVLMEMFILFCEDLVVQAMGKKHRKLTPYAMYLIMYIFVGSLISLIGIESLATSYTIAFSLGLISFLSVYYFGFKYQKWAYFKRYKNPIEIFTQFTPLISISFRLFGNLLGGSIILGLVYALFINVQSSFDGTGNHVGRIYGTVGGFEDNWNYQYIYFWSGFNIFTTAFAPWLHMYFDLFDGGVQALVFTMLTFSYWSEAMGETDDSTSVKTVQKGKGSILHRHHGRAEKTTSPNEDLAIQIAL
ncbi:ATP synthase subunit a [Mesoplasma sp. JKS002658]|uniref:F0F1 ATP synthase subunit A n=1 Tax=Mesoplasma whartonense TaxID=2878854 RepID=UPI002022B5B1|nr:MULTISPECIES: F0F1 ATP synthase subunit A [unclassified Mesoplasma]MCL8211729.1 ATP synthase subunit a [Mesoplasma sp. JKS002664]MCL8212106.1 ATP synthase subunit a [Mesoplasma sp. JKS002662]MCL8212729.1 ATP synthase subunit a [Mesoplasma sp. JKS002661]MCL8213789.1 ATP synthase subunit a [Mesoplasma sp. JKS002658]MCL8215065.1 ATP synthase subunit a [Mesoplasma sp. JKS002663]